MSVNMNKICDASIVEPLCLILKTSFDSGIYPSTRKEANIVLFHKKSSRQDKINYSPISLSPTSGKIFEKLCLTKFIYIFVRLSC